jgi:hypothetical protein
MSKAALKVEMDDSRSGITVKANGLIVTITRDPDLDDEGDDDDLALEVSKRPRPDHPKPRLHVVQKPAKHSCDEYDADVELWLARALS